ncbi:cilia- and flagella-associated protein 299 isoform X2 [Manis pentadactyla]|uniref:cilia- and flagella-associated protein 299 isoform X2 n=1 Tax=Manis pentadactyla TaxID=143292 RepID=UPI00255CD7DA|nr:cilia- and flagella-associated protein 299 isoform X2 [Manis pentadactyla]
MDQEEALTAVDNIVTQFNTYEDFLDSQITTMDLYYLEDEGLARQLVELGYRGTGEVVKREDFEARKATIEIARLAEKTQKKTLTSAGKDLQDNFLKALAAREEDNRNGKMSSVIFIRDRNSHGQEVSGYIDYAHRLKMEDFEVYFSGKRRLLPRHTDMRQIPTRGIVGYNKLMFNIIRSCQTVFQRYPNTLHSHQYSMSSLCYTSLPTLLF